jgi:membrane protein implicated in regulation of membrane protease activity
MIYATALVVLGGLFWGAALARLLAESFPVQLGFLFNWPATLTLTVIVAALTLFTWRQVSGRLAHRTEKPYEGILGQDALAHLPSRSPGRRTRCAPP